MRRCVIMFVVISFPSAVRKTDPLRRGLRHAETAGFKIIGLIEVRKTDPLRRGLRPGQNLTTSKKPCPEVRKTDPLRRGLRLTCIKPNNGINILG